MDSGDGTNYHRVTRPIAISPTAHLNTVRANETRPTKRVRRPSDVTATTKYDFSEYVELSLKRQTFMNHGHGRSMPALFASVVLMAVFLVFALFTDNRVDMNSLFFVFSVFGVTILCWWVVPYFRAAAVDEKMSSLKDTLPE